jgi:CRP-like cAMP-binding protein
LVLPADSDLYRQGEAADNLYYLDSGAVTIGVASGGNEPIVVCVHGPGTFFGARSLQHEAHNSTATALLESTVIRVSKIEVQSLLLTNPTFARHFAVHMLRRTAVLEEEQIDRVVNSTEKRLARMLLILGSLDVESESPRVMARITETKLARMLAADPLCIRKFVQKFRRAGHLGPGEPLTVHSSLANVLLSTHQA